MAKLTPEEEEFVRLARELAEERAALPSEDRVPMANPDKFGDPIGMDDDGNLFPVEGGDEKRGSGPR
jgi:hypothetical protein